MFEFMIRRILEAHDLDTVEGRVGALRAAAPAVAGIRDQSLSIGYVRNLARWLGMDPTEVARAVRTAASRPTEAGRTSATHDHARDSHLDSRPVERGPSIADLSGDFTTRLERDALMALLQHPEAVSLDLAQRAIQVVFANASLAVVRDGIAVSMDAYSSANWLDRVVDEVPTLFATLVKELGVAPIPVKDGHELTIYCTGVISALIDRDLVRRKAELLGRLQRFDSIADPARYRELQQELMRIEQERRLLRGD